MGSDSLFRKRDAMNVRSADISHEREMSAESDIWDSLMDKYPSKHLPNKHL